MCLVYYSSNIVLIAMCMFLNTANIMSINTVSSDQKRMIDMIHNIKTPNCATFFYFHEKIESGLI